MPRDLSTYLGRNVSPLLLRDRILQYYGRGVDEITLALGHPQVDATVGPRLHIDISIPSFDLGVTLEGKGMGGVVGQHSFGQSRPLHPFEVLKFVVNLYRYTQSG